MLKLIKNIWFILTLDCEKSAYLTSQSFDRNLHWAEKVAVYLHCLICNKSRRLNRQLTALNDRLGSKAAPANQYQLSEAAVNRIKSRLDDEVDS